VVVGLMLVAAGTYLGFSSGWFQQLTSKGPHAPPTAPTTPVASHAPQTPLAPLPRPVTTPATAATTAAPPTPQTAATQTAAPPTSAATTAPTASVAATAPPRPSATPSATPSAKPAGDPASLSPTRGYLVVDSPKEMGVFIAGNFRGLTGAQIEVDCGIKYVRLGVAPNANGESGSAGIVWTSEGKSANVACRSVTHVAMTPTK
jgi:hypothetical protein